MQDAAAFPPDYDTARTRFREAAKAAGAKCEAHLIDATGPRGQELTIDVASLGVASARRALVVSSGIHGAEGPVGSAIQTTWLASRFPRAAIPRDVKLVFLHGLNPYGFAWRRRVNEDNVDLNRNFLLPGEEYRGAPRDYAALDPLLNPPSLPSCCDLFLLKALVAELRFGWGCMRRTLPVGQYEFPRGLFFGGHAPSQTNRILAEQLPRWLAGTEEVLHLDLHTGLGRWGRHKLLMTGAADSPEARWFHRHFGSEVVETSLPAERESSRNGVYPTRGDWDPWCRATFADRTYRFATVEFGTYSTARVAVALRAENRAHHYLPHSDRRWEKTKTVFLETFAPADAGWREKALRQGQSVLDQGLAAIGLVRPRTARMN